jgi:hypothetical protein
MLTNLILGWTGYKKLNGYKIILAVNNYLSA